MGERVVKIAKNLLGVLWQDKLGIKRIVSKNWIYFRKCIFCHKTPKYQKNVFKVWNNKILAFFTVFTKSTQEKIIELESESDIFLQNRKIYHCRLPITTFA